MTTRTDVPPLTRELRAEFAGALERAFTAGGATTTAEQVAILQELLRRCREEGQTPAGPGWMYVNRELGVEWTNPRVLRQATGGPVGGELRGRLLVAGALVVGGVLLLVLNAALAGGKPSRPGPVTPTATPAPGTPTATATVVPLEGIKIGGQGVPAVFPVTLQIGAHAWAIGAAPVSGPGGNWKVSVDPGTANWLPGSVVNWSFGLWDDAGGTNRGVLTGIGAGGVDATLRMSSGVARGFHLGAARPVSRLQSAIFGQSQPGLTLVLLGSPGDTRLVSVGSAAPAGAAPLPPGEGVSRPSPVP